MMQWNYTLMLMQGCNETARGMLHDKLNVLARIYELAGEAILIAIWPQYYFASWINIMYYFLDYVYYFGCKPVIVSFVYKA